MLTTARRVSFFPLLGRSASRSGATALFSATSTIEPPQHLEKTVLVVGGTGFVGSAIIRELLLHDEIAKIISVSKNAPSREIQKEHAKVDYVCANLLFGGSFSEFLKDVDGAVLCVGTPPIPTFSDRKRQEQTDSNGACNVEAIWALNEHTEAKRLVALSASMPRWIASGYRRGKEQTERATAAWAKDEAHPERAATVLKMPAVFDGSNRASPLQMISSVLRLFRGPIKVLERLAPAVFENALVPFIDVRVVARVVVAKLLAETSTSRVEVLEGADAISSHDPIRNH